MKTKKKKVEKKESTEIMPALHINPLYIYMEVHVHEMHTRTHTHTHNTHKSYFFRHCRSM